MSEANLPRVFNKNLKNKEMFSKIQNMKLHETSNMKKRVLYMKKGSVAFDIWSPWLEFLKDSFQMLFL